MAAPGRVVGGLHPVRELLRSSQRVDRILVARTRDRTPVVDDIVAEAADRGVEVERVDRDALDRRAEGLVHQGVLALAPAFPYLPLDDLLARVEAARDHGPAIFVALDGVTDPHNLGSIARTAWCCRHVARHRSPRSSRRPRPAPLPTCRWSRCPTSYVRSAS